MIDIQLSIRRSSGLWGGTSSETVNRYRRELEELKQQLESFSFLYDRNLFGSEELMRKVRFIIEEEIRYCFFFNEYKSRQALEPDIGTWVLIKQEDVKPEYDWMKVTGEQWVKTNGRIKAIIQFDRSGSMVKITLTFRNDSKQLFFVQHGDGGPDKTIHLKSEKSIAAKVQELKITADNFLESHLYPLYITNNIDILKELLCIQQVF